MNKLKPLSQSLLSASQLQFIAIQTMDITKSLAEIDPYIKKQHDSMNESNSTIEKIYAYSRINEKTAELASADDMQDDVLFGIRDYLKGLIALARFDTGKSEAAKKILSHMESYGHGLFYGGHEKQAALIPAFISSLKTPEFAPSVEKATISHLIDGLTMAQKSVHDLYHEKLQANNKPDSTLTEEKKALRYRINSLFTYLDTNINDGVEGFTSLETPLNLLITDVMGQFRAQQTRKEHSETVVEEN